MLESFDAAGQAAIVVDARGLGCPWPVLRLARAVRDGGTCFVLLADDPATAGELAALAHDRGWQAAADGLERYRIRVDAA